MKPEYGMDPGGQPPEGRVWPTIVAVFGGSALFAVVMTWLGVNCT
jgi:hypothetical protein